MKTEEQGGIPDGGLALARMQALLQRWQENDDRRTVFLSCYAMMTSNMLAAIERHEFADPGWTRQLLERFAGYYFAALESYERSAEGAPPVWRLAHDAARDPDCSALQQLMLGVSAHINYDLVFTVVDVLEVEWLGLGEDQIAVRHADFCHVNEVIAGTIDAVQDRVLEPLMPILDLVDRLLGPVDELAVSHLISLWRAAVWRSACEMLRAKTHEQALVALRVEDEALRIGMRICLQRVPAWLEQRRWGQD